LAPRSDRREEEAMERMRRVFAAALCAAALSIPLAAPAGAHPLPEAACNEGTETAHGSIPTGDNPAHERIPHDDGEGCVHGVGQEV
jgi:hypothetical protein